MSCCDTYSSSLPGGKKAATLPFSWSGVATRWLTPASSLRRCGVALPLRRDADGRRGGAALSRIPPRLSGFTLFVNLISVHTLALACGRVFPPVFLSLPPAARPLDLRKNSSLKHADQSSYQDEEINFTTFQQQESAFQRERR